MRRSKEKIGKRGRVGKGGGGGGIRVRMGLGLEGKWLE